MERKIIVERIVAFYYETGLISEATFGKEELKAIVESCLEKAEYIETIINTIIIRAKTHKNLDIEKMKELLIGLERIRLELEYQDYGKVS